MVRELQHLRRCSRAPGAISRATRPPTMNTPPSSRPIDGAGDDRAPACGRGTARARGAAGPTGGRRPPTPRPARASASRTRASPGLRVSEIPEQRAPITSTTTTTMRRRRTSDGGSSYVDRRPSATIAPISAMQPRHAAPFGARPISVSSPVRHAAGDGSGHQRRAGRAQAARCDGVTMRGQPCAGAARRRPPSRVGVGEVVRVGQSVDGPRPAARQRQRDRFVDADEAARRVGHQIVAARRSDAVIG